MVEGPRDDGGKAGKLNLVVALAAEAQSLAECFGLQPVSGKAPFRRFRRPDRAIEMVVSGVGKAASAAAAATLAAPNRAWLNIGMGGHHSLPLGSLVLAHKICDDESGHSWFPPMALDPPCQAACVRTVNEPLRDYPTADVFEMEASGFYEAASRSSTHELVHCLKIISDNTISPTCLVSNSRVGRLLAQGRSVIEELVEALLDLSSQQMERHRVPPEFECFTARWHFSQTEKRLLRRLLQRWASLCPQEDPLATVAGPGARAQTILAALQAGLRELELRFDGR
ncbi:MAG: hypothetical protein ACE5HV_15300 [Acidobacteriota bacterium]